VLSAQPERKKKAPAKFAGAKEQSMPAEASVFLLTAPFSDLTKRELIRLNAIKCILKSEKKSRAKWVDAA